MRCVNLTTAALAGAGGVQIAELADALGSLQFGLRLLALEDGRGEGEYHFHHAIEEWLVVLAGAPVVRTPARERTLREGDVLCFPPGAAGAHRVTGPGRVLMLSDKARLDAIEFPDSGAVYLHPAGRLLHGEPETMSGAAAGGGRAPLNLGDVSPGAYGDPGEPAGFGRRAERIAEALGAARIGAAVYEADPGLRVWPYHYEGIEEEGLLVLTGTPTLRDPEGEHHLSPGDLVWFPPGPEGAHQIVNRSDGVARFVMFSNVPDVSISVYPDSDKLSVWPWPGRRIRIGDEVPYWDGEG